MILYSETDERDINSVIFGLNELSEKKGTLDSVRRAQIHELVLLIKDKKLTIENALSTLKQNYTAIGFSIESVEDKISLCRNYIEEFGDNQFWKKDLYSINADTSRDLSVAVLENPYVIAAKDRFAANRNFNPVFFHSFNEICDAVSNGACDYGIIPTESSESGKLLRFYTLIDQYDLNINAVCDVAGVSGGITRYALVGKNTELFSFGSPDYFEFSISLDSHQSLTDILLAASLCSMELHRIDSVPIPYKDMEYSFHTAFSVKGADLDTFLLYMYLNFPQYVPIGIFSKT